MKSFNNFRNRSNFLTSYLKFYLVWGFCAIIVKLNAFTERFL